MVVKTIVVRNLFSFEYEGSNPSLPTIKYKFNLYFILQAITNKCLEEEIMHFNINKEKGNSGLGMAIAYFSTNGYTVSIPLNDTQDYDLVVEKDGILKTIQVKATGCKTKNNIFQVALKSCGGTKGKEYKTIINTNVDYIFILDAEKKMYLIPKSEIVNKSTINLGKRTEKYTVNM